MNFCREVRLYHEDIRDRIRVEITLDEKDIEKIKNTIVSIARCGMDGDGCLSVFNADKFKNFHKPAHMTNVVLKRIRLE